MNWMSKVAIGMLLFATLLIALGVMFIRANEYLPTTSKVNQNMNTSMDTNIEAKAPALITPPATQASSMVKK